LESKAALWVFFGVQSSDFGSKTDADVIKHLLKYARPYLAMRLRRYKGLISYDYNWRLNQP
jgi:hypothetical protein